MYHFRFQGDNQPSKKQACSKWLGTCYKLVSDSEDGGDTFLQNVGSHMSYMELHPRRWQHSITKIVELTLRECLERTNYLLSIHYILSIDRLCGLVVRVLGCRSGGPGSIPGTTRKKKGVGLERGSPSLVRTTEELLDRKVAAPV
jgi:hypothetical protein